MKLVAATILSISALLMSAGTASASELHRIAPGTTPAVSTVGNLTPQQLAQNYLRTEAGRFKLATVVLVPKVTLGFRGYHTVRFEQVHRGVAVIGGAAAVRLAPDGRVRVVALAVSRGLTVNTTPFYTRSEASVIVQGQAGWSRLHAFKTKLAVLPSGASGGRLVWLVDVPDTRGGQRYRIDAKSGDLLAVHPLAKDALGRVYPISETVTPATQDLELAGLSDASPIRLNSADNWLKVVNYVSGGSQTAYTVEQTLGTSDGSNFLYDPPADATAIDAFSQVMIYYHLTRTRSFFEDNFGINFGLIGWRLAAVANLLEDGEFMGNAFYSEQGLSGDFSAPNLIGIGQGPDVDFAVDSDVFIHEFFHYLSKNAINYNMGQFSANEYGLNQFSGSLDEGLGDYFACTMNGDPILGEASLGTAAERDLTDDSKSCPGGVFGEVHADGEIIGSLCWTIRETLGAAIADQLVWGAASLLLPYASFGDFAAALDQSAADLVVAADMTSQQADDIHALLVSRGLDDCFNELPLDEGSPRTSYMFGLDMVGQFMGRDCAGVRDFGVQLHSLFHFRTTSQTDAIGITFTADVLPEMGNDLNWGIYVRVGQHVQFASSGFFPSISAFDYGELDITGTTASITIDASSNPPFDPGADYHMVVAHTNCPNTELTVSVAHENAPDPVYNDAGVIDTPTPKPSCGCRSTTSGSVPLWMLTLGLLFLVRRRRRR